MENIIISIIGGLVTVLLIRSYFMQKRLVFVEGKLPIIENCVDQNSKANNSNHRLHESRYIEQRNKIADINFTLCEMQKKPEVKTKKTAKKNVKK